MTLSPRFEQALVYASVVHAGQRRKGKDVPYIGHLMSVAALVLEHSAGDEWANSDVSREDLAIAALLHDAVEDAGGLRRLEDIRVRFGEAVADIVRQCSDSEGEPKPPWRERKEAYLAHLRDRATPAARLVSLADKLDNIRDIVMDYRRLGDGLFDRFNAGKADQLWYQRALADAFLEKLPCPLAEEFHRVVGEFERLAKGGGTVRPVR